MDELSKIAQKYVTDKFGHHNYTPIYDRYFSSLRNNPIVLIEAGIGGYHLPLEGGGSLRMWAEYFSNAKIVGFDIHEKQLSFMGDATKISIFRGAQDDAEFLDRLFTRVGQPDIFIDDCSHDTPLTLKTFEIVFPFLKSGGIYVVEDAHASYWDNQNHHGTIDIGAHKYSSPMNYFKALTDSLNREHIAGYASFKEFWGKVYSVHFYEKMIFILKI